MDQVRVRVRFTDDSILEGVKRYIGQLRDSEFYGVLEIQFQNGEIVLIRKQESFKPAAFLVVE